MQADPRLRGSCSSSPTSPRSRVFPGHLLWLPPLPQFTRPARTDAAESLPLRGRRWGSSELPRSTGDLAWLSWAHASGCLPVFGLHSNLCSPRSQFGLEGCCISGSLRAPAASFLGPLPPPACLPQSFSRVGFIFVIYVFIRVFKAVGGQIGLSEI